MKTLNFSQNLNLFLILNFIYLFIIIKCENSGQNCNQNGFCNALKFKKSYILYHVNDGEGFNLRKDIFIRIAPLIKYLNQKDKENEWNLVLPPWGNIPHWRKNSNKFHSWDKFFDLESINSYLPVIEFDQYLNDHGLDNKIDMAFQLENYPFESLDSSFSLDENTEIFKCNLKNRFKNNNDQYYKTVWGLQLTMKDVKCLKLMGYGVTLGKFLIENNFIKNSRSLLFTNSEVILWESYGDKSWWDARKVLKFSKRLIKIGEEYIKSEFPDEKYLGVHLRRRDFIAGRSDKFPSLKVAAGQITEKMKSFNLKAIFLASDAPDEEILEFEKYLKNSKTGENNIKFQRFICDKDLLEGECAIIDQIICSRSSFFIGTSESTFTLRIFEEREILGKFSPESTFNTLCPDSNINCKKPTQWLIK